MSANPNGGQRAFAQKLSRYQAADVRRRVAATASLTLGGQDRVDSSSSSGGRLANNHAPRGSVSGATGSRESSVEPPDFEELIDQYQDALRNDPLRDVVLFPDDDVEVVCVPRRCRTVVPLLPELDPQSGSVDPRLYDSIRSYTRDWIAVHRRQVLIHQ
jgi:hypothetical protein